MCIRDRASSVQEAITGTPSPVFPAGIRKVPPGGSGNSVKACLLYTSDAADERSSVDLGGRRIIKKKKNETKLLEYETQTEDQPNNSR
mgnify:CR=1 FL=1